MAMAPAALRLLLAAVLCRPCCCDRPPPVRPPPGPCDGSRPARQGAREAGAADPGAAADTVAQAGARQHRLRRRPGAAARRQPARRRPPPAGRRRADGRRHRAARHLVPITPGGTGIAEIGAIAWLVGSGLDPVQAVAGVLLYRVFLRPGDPRRRRAARRLGLVGTSPDPDRDRGGGMRVLHVTDHYPPVLGGIETHVAALAERQACRGDDVTVLTSTPATADGRVGDDTGAGRVRRVRSRRDVSVAGTRPVSTWCTRTCPWSRRSPRRWSRRPPAVGCRRWSPCTRCGAGWARCRPRPPRLAGLRRRRCGGPR